MIDARSGAALAAATVGVLPDGRSLFSASADSLGRFRVPLPRAGRYALSVSRVGYEALTTAAASVGSNQLLELELRLSVDPIELGSLVVTARRSALGAHEAYEQRLEWVSRTGFGHVITCADLEAARLPFLSSYIARVPGVTLATDRAGRTYPLVRACVPALYMNGVPLPLGATSIDDLLSPDELEGIEVYTSRLEIPPESAIHLQRECVVSERCSLVHTTMTPQMFGRM